MTLAEAAKKGITRLAYVRNGKPVWNEYSFGDIAVFDDGSIGPWMHVYDPCGMLASGRPAWTSIPVMTIPVVTQLSVGHDAEFEPFEAPDDMDRFPGCPPVPKIIQRVPNETPR